MHPVSEYLPLTVLLLLALAVLGAAVGIRLARIPGFARTILPFSGGLLMGIAAFWILPEVQAHYGRLQAVAEAAAGFGVLVLVNRYLYSICPTCSHAHGHGQAHGAALPGFGAPLFVAASIHSFLDGWSLGVSAQDGSVELRTAFLLGIGLHKIPEGLALGVVFFAATRSAWKAMLSCLAIQSTMLLGAALASSLSSALNKSLSG